MQLLKYFKNLSTGDKFLIVIVAICIVVGFAMMGVDAFSIRSNPLAPDIKGSMPFRVELDITGNGG